MRYSQTSPNPVLVTQPMDEEKRAQPPAGLVGPRLRSARERRGWSQTELAYHASLSMPEVSRFEHNVRDPRSSTLARLACVLGVSADYLLGLTDTDKPHPKPDPQPQSARAPASSRKRKQA